MAADQILTRNEARAVLRGRLATWPVIDDATVQFLRSLHWRVRQAVILVHGERLTVGAAAVRLGVSERTIYYDLSLADAQYQGAARPVARVPDRLDLCETGVRSLAAAIVLQAWRDALDGADEAPAARGWLQSHPWAETLCEACDVDWGRLVAKMEAMLRERAD